RSSPQLTFSISLSTRSICHSPFPLFFFKCYAAHRALHSFPTRRSSDLDMASQVAEKTILGLENPMGTDGFEFVEYTAPDTALLRSEEHTSELQSRRDLVCRLLLEKKKTQHSSSQTPANEPAWPPRTRQR